MTPYYADDLVTLHHGDCLDVMADLEPVSVDAVVTDPPYELGFMGRSWDASGVAYRPETWAAALRVLKPGGHLLAFGGTRTYHRMTVAIEDAGFEVRDCIAWMYGSGFPKSMNVAKAVTSHIETGGSSRTMQRQSAMGDAYEPNEHAGKGSQRTTITGTVAPPSEQRTSPEGDAWKGWGTALKPAHEPIVVARKPLQGTVAGNVLAHGTGALNIDATRVGEADGFGGGRKASSGFVGGYESDGFAASTQGRWPANVVMDPEAGAVLDAQSGDAGANGGAGSFVQHAWMVADSPQSIERDNRGGASRFFYCAKASKADRGPGNSHPTVKPVELMRWLVRLVTPPGGTVLDPFAGSGSTLVAAVIEGFHAVGIEREPEYAQIIRARLTAPIASVLDLGGAA